MPTFEMMQAPEQWFEMNKARNFTEFKAALSRQSVPCFNIVYADRFDTIMYLSNVTIPYRNPAFDWGKVLPGYTSATLWDMKKFHPFEELPHVVNPASGYVFNANNSPFLCTDPQDNPNPDLFDATMGTQRLHTNRSKRFERLLGEASVDGQITWKEFHDIKYDMQYPDTFEFPVEINHLFTADPARYPDIAAELARLQRWDRRGDTTSMEASLFSMALHFIMEKTGGPDMTLNIRPELPDTMVADAIRRGRDYLLKHFGTVDVPLGRLQRLQRGQTDLALNGLPDMIVAMYSAPRPDGTMAPTAGESYIMMVKMDKNGPEIQTVNAYGASARPGSPHAVDQMPLFTRQKLKPMTLDWKQVKKDAVKTYSPQ